jgi:hypothetical protein
VHLVGFIIRIYHDARSVECQKSNTNLYEELTKTICLKMLQKHKKSIQKVCEVPMICFSFKLCNKNSDDFSKFSE